MSVRYSKELTRIVVAQICQTIGYHSAQSASLEVLQDILDKFLKEFTRDLRRQVEHCLYSILLIILYLFMLLTFDYCFYMNFIIDNRNEVTLSDVALSLDSIKINVDELIDYINNVEPVSFAFDVPKFPVPKESSLNFLHPDSSEMMTRPKHIYSYLPPILPPDMISHTQQQNQSQNLGELSIGEMNGVENTMNISVTDGKEQLSIPNDGDNFYKENGEEGMRICFQLLCILNLC